MGKMSNTDEMNAKRLNIMDKILNRMDLELDLMSSNPNSIDFHEKVCKNIITLADAFNRLDLWVDDSDEVL